MNAAETAKAILITFPRGFISFTRPNVAMELAREAISPAAAASLMPSFPPSFMRGFLKSLVIIFTWVLVLILIVYVLIIKLDVFALLEEAGIDTSGRVVIYNAVDKFYEFSPEFLGNGIGFLTYQLSSNMSVGVNAVHNDFLQYFIDLGFWGYILWLVSMTTLRVCYFGKNGNTNKAILLKTLYTINQDALLKCFISKEKVDTERF